MTMTTQHQWESWIGRTQVQRDMISRARLAKWLATFDTAQPEDGTVPQGYHWCLCTPDAPLSSLGEDGHPKRTGDEDSFMPPVPLPRRMWASSTIKFLRPLRIGDAISRTSRIDKITEKQGGSGRLTFVELSHDICSHDETILEEAQTIVYREAAPYDAPLS
ncbi:MaoC family dehydratase N-terminal domain-containing protein, partial [Hyphomonas sp. ND6WE1B]|uniref:FAS1-like dehydratase domain-containing protein n=1 Tax=Hyphomonas sp. ND6WE1B TaxID=1848191 RepID=UPI000B0A0607